MAVSRQTKTLRNTTPEAFIRKIERIPDKAVRAVVAYIVWWDVFSSRLVQDRTTAFDRYLNDPSFKHYADRVNAEDVIEGLISVGYDPAKAPQRVFFDLTPSCAGKRPNARTTKAPPSFLNNI